MHMSDFTYSCVFILSNGVTASSDSVAPAPNPAITVAGPETLPSASASMFLYMSNATNPTQPVRWSLFRVGSLPHTYASLQRVANDQGCASSVPLLAERRPWQLLSVWQSSVELRSCFRDYAWVRLGVVVQVDIIQCLHSAGYVIAGVESVLSICHDGRASVTYFHGSCTCTSQD